MMAPSGAVVLGSSGVEVVQEENVGEVGVDRLVVVGVWMGYQPLSHSS